MQLRIAQVGSLWENTPPPKYGGTERVVSLLTEGLVKRGFDVTLFACGSSTTAAKLVSVYPRPLYRDGIAWTNVGYPLLHITEAFDREHEFDIIHVHLNKASDYLALPLAVRLAQKTVFTLHFPYPSMSGREDRHKILQKYKKLNFVSISNSQRQGGENLNWIATVYNGIDMSKYSFSGKPEDYVLWLGKFNPDKGTKEAILAAREAGVVIRVAGAIDTTEGPDFVYYRDEVKPMLDGISALTIGEVNDEEKDQLYGHALAFLNPIKWNEPFGLVMAEAMATGTPVIAFPNGAAPELIIDGKTGYLVGDIHEMAARIKMVGTLSRQVCREHIEKKFSSDKMVDGYINVYNTILKDSKI